MKIIRERIMPSKYQYFYLIELQYLGFRYHGWQYQDSVKTIQGVIEKTLHFIFDKGSPLKVLVSGRTDAMVSAQSAYFELFLQEEVSIDNLMQQLNHNLPADIKVLSIQKVDEQFNVIQHVRSKTYHYYFAAVSEKYPFATPFMNCIQEDLNIHLMQLAAKLFEGEHDFKHFYKGDDAGTKNTVRNIEQCEIIENDILQANFFPSISYVLVVRSKGFMRYQIRMMMGALIKIGCGEISLQTLETALKGDELNFEKSSAAPSGLMVHQVKF